MLLELDSKLKETALRLLARREHSTRELRNKLTTKGFSPEAVITVLQWCSDENWLSDARFAEHYLRHRCQRGFGPGRIQAELYARGVSQEIVENCLAAAKEQWSTWLVEVYRKRYGETAPKDQKERARRIRFLMQRGFSQAQIRDHF